MRSPCWKKESVRSNLRVRLEALEAKAIPKTEVRFTMNENEIDESIPGVIWVFFAIEEPTNNPIRVQQAV